MNKFLALSPQARYVLVLRGRNVLEQLRLAAEKAPNLTIGELMKLEEAANA